MIRFNRREFFKKSGIFLASLFAIGYVLSLPVSVAIIGCKSPQEVEENVHIAKTFHVLSQGEMLGMESLTKKYFEDGNFYKK